MTQAEQCVRELRAGWRTWCQLQRLWIQSPQKRLAEAAHKFLKPGEVIERKTGSDGLIRLRVVRK